MLHCAFIYIKEFVNFKEGLLDKPVLQLVFKFRIHDSTSTQSELMYCRIYGDVMSSEGCYSRLAPSRAPVSSILCCYLPLLVTFEVTGSGRLLRHEEEVTS